MRKVADKERDSIYQNIAFDSKKFWKDFAKSCNTESF